MQLVRDFQTLVVALNYHQARDPDKLQVVCDRISKAYIQLHPWARPSSAIHKVLVHGSQLVRVSPLPLGVLSEEGGEAKNKDYRNDRQHHARKLQPQGEPH